MKLGIRIAIPAVLGFLLFLQCTVDSPTASGGNTSDVGNAAVAGLIVDENGNPVPGATVRLVPVSFNPQGLTKRLAKSRSLTAAQLRAAILATADSAVTDSNGQYSFDTVDTGTYNVLADSGSTMAFQDSVSIDDPDTQTTVPTDTLKAPGSLRGVVRLQPGHDSRTVFIIALGTFAVTAPSDSIGNFVMANMAEGTYSTRLLSTLDDYGVLDTSLSITAGLTDTLADSIKLPYTGIPIPAGLSIAYDSLKQLVTLTWNTPTTGRTVKGYNVYRKHADSTSFVKIAGVVADTTYTDSTAVQDQTYEYKVAAVDTAETEGTKSGGVSVEVASGFELVDSLGALGTGDGQFTLIRDLCFDQSGNLYVVSHDNPDGDNPKIQKFDSSLNFVWSVGAKGTDTSQFIRPWGIAVDSQLNLYVADRGNARIQKYNSNGTFAGFMSGTLGDSSALESPRFLAAQGEKVFVADYSESQYYSTVKVYDSNGNFLTKWGEKGDGNGQFVSIYSIKVTVGGEIITLDENGFQFFTATGDFIRSIDVSDYGTMPRDFDIVDSTIYLTMSGGKLVLLNLAGELEGTLSTEDDNLTQIAVRREDQRIFLYFYSEHQIEIYRKN